MTTEPLQCARMLSDGARCPNPAHLFARISFAAMGDPEGPRGSLIFPLPVCSEHTNTDPGTYITAEGWAQLTEALGEVDEAPPDPQTARVDFVESINHD